MLDIALCLIILLISVVIISIIILIYKMHQSDIKKLQIITSTRDTRDAILKKERLANPDVNTLESINDETHVHYDHDVFLTRTD